MRQALLAGLVEQFYHYVVKDWLDGDPAQPRPPPPQRGRDATASGATCTTPT
jgi:hypothetical protein